MSARSDVPVVWDLASQLSGAGFQVRTVSTSEGGDFHITDLKEVEDSAAVVAVVDGPNSEFFIDLAYLLGRGCNVWILSEDINILPGILRRASFVQLEGKNTSDTLIDQIRECLRIETPTAADMEDLSSLVSWLREDTDRIAGLSSRDLERLVLSILNDLGLRYESAAPTPEAEMVFSDPQSRTLVFVEVKSQAAGQKLGVGTVERSVANALSHGCDFTVLVSPNEFTSAAVEYASFCAPPVWLLDRELLESWVVGRSESHQNTHKNAKPFFDRMLRKPRGLLSASSESNKDSGAATQHDVGADVRGLWFAKLIEMEFKRLRYKRLSYGTEPKRCEMFFSFNRSRKFKEVEQLIQLIYLLDDEGVKVWHDSPQLDVGEQCLDLGHVSMAVKRCDLVFYFLGHGASSSVSDAKILQTVAAEIAKTPEELLKAFIIGNDNVWNRLKLPAVFKESVFLDPSQEEWRNAFIEICRRIIQIATSSPKELEK